MNQRCQWALLLAFLITAMPACSKKEETPAPAPQATTQPQQQTGMEEAKEKMKEAHEGMKQMHEGMVAGMEMGKAVYEKTCAACHETGVAGAPRFGDKTAWAPHIAEGIDHLVQMALMGEGAMPAKGGNPALSEEEVRAAVTYMIENSR